jgi:hypothetical protein
MAAQTMDIEYILLTAKGFFGQFVIEPAGGKAVKQL